MYVRRFVVVSVVVHAALAIIARALLPMPVERMGESTLEIAFTLTPSALKPPDDAVGLAVEGIEDARDTGLASGPTRGRAGDAVHGSAAGIHVRGDDARDRFAAGAKDAQALTGWLASGLAEVDGARSPYDATYALGARDEASLGARGTSIVAPGERGLDMLGTGHGACVGEDCAAGTIGDTVLGPGSLGGRADFAASFGRRSRVHVRTVCVTDTACARRRSHLIVVVEVIGALDRTAARRIVARHRPAIVSCIEDASSRPELELLVAPSGRVSQASSTDACMRRLGERLAFPAAAAPSVVTVRVQVFADRWR